MTFRMAGNILLQEFRSSYVVGGAVSLAGGYGVSQQSDEWKKEYMGRVVRLYRQQGIEEKNLSDQDLRDTVWQSVQSADSVIKASPLFYFSYHAIHKSGLPLKKHVLRATVKGVSGTLASVPAMFLFYGLAAGGIPQLQNHLMNRNWEKEDAKTAAQAGTFLVGGPLLEFGVEALGCGLKTGQLRTGPWAVGTIAIAGRLWAGVLPQFQAADSNKTKEDPHQKEKDLAKVLFGTTLAQHLVNASMKSMESGCGSKGIVNYLKYGQVVGGFNPKMGMLQLGKTGVQRVAFSFLWNHLTHNAKETPSYLKE